MADTQKDQPSYQNAAYQEMCEAWTFVRDVCKGTLHLRHKGKAYLLQEPKEQEKNYENRIRTAILFNATARTLNGLVGMVFRKDPKLGTDVPEWIRGREGKKPDEEIGILQGLVNAVRGKTDPNETGLWARVTGIAKRYQEFKAANPAEEIGAVEGLWENIDNAGTHGAVFAKELFTDAMRDGHALIYVDAPPLPVRADGNRATLQDIKNAKWRPYFVAYTADQIVNWRVAVLNGKPTLTQITLKECGLEPDGAFAEKTVTRYRVLQPGKWTLYREQAENKENPYVIESEGETPFKEITVAPVYSRKTGFLKSSPPLLDIALINIQHYQKHSDYSTYIKMCKPVLWFRNRDDSKAVEPIGPFTFFEVGADGTVEFAEPTGASLGATRTDIQDLEALMAALGISIIAGKSPNPNTATEEILDHVQEESDLATAARSLKDGLELALKYLVQYQEPDATSGGSVELGATLQELTLPPAEMREYTNMVANHILSKKTYRGVLKRAGKLLSNFEDEKEDEQIKVEMQESQALLQAQFDRGFGKPNLGESGDDPPQPNGES